MAEKTKKEIFFSVVIPSYNRSEFIVTTINSFLQQNYKFFEVIVVDDGSTDNTKEIVSSIPDKRVRFFYKQNGERGAARNFGANAAKGDYINFFDSDDLAYPNHLEIAAKVINRLGDPEVFHLGHEEITPQKKVLYKGNNYNGDVKEYCIKRKKVSINAIFLRRDISFTVPFSENRALSVSEDALWLCQLASRFRIYYENTITSAIVNHNDRSMITTSEEKLFERKRIFNEELKRDNVFMAKYGHLLKYVNAEFYYLLFLMSNSKGNKRKGFSYFLKAVKLNPKIFFSSRTAVVVKWLFSKNNKRQPITISESSSNQKFLFSVIIPTYNRENFIGDTISSFLKQDYLNIEILVVDDGSTDNTKQIVESIRDERVKYYRKENGERGAARNYGAKLAQGKYLTFFDSDDIVYPWYISNAFKSLSKVNFPECYAQAFEMRNKAPAIPPSIKSIKNNISSVNKKLYTENILACNGVFVRRDIFDQIKFSENRDLSGSEDWLLWLQLSATYPFYYSPVVCSCLINHDQRGELNIKQGKLLKRLHILIDLIKSDKRISTLPRTHYRTALAACYQFAALKMADFAKLKFVSIGNWFRAFFLNPLIVVHKTTYVTLKKLFFSWHS